MRATRVQGKPVTATAPGDISDRPSSRRAADAAVDAGANRGDAGAGLLRRGGDRPRPHAADADARARCQARADLLIPVVKAWCTDQGVEIASLGVQVHGGMGYIEETGAAQYYRDARIAPIYEGTNGIQANDLVGRKVQRDGGAATAALIAEMRGAAAGNRDVARRHRRA